MTIPTPRLLPLTIAVMVVLLLVKATSLVRAATPSAEPAPPPAPISTAAPAPGAAAMPTKPGSSALTAAQVDPERSLLLDLRHRRAALDARDAALASREAVLKATEKRVTDRLRELGDLQARLEALEQARKAHDAQNWGGLVKLYEQMKPRDAATIFNDLDKPVLLGVLDRMKAAKAAAVLAAMMPERARQATADLARLRTQNNTPSPPSG